MFFFFSQDSSTPPSFHPFILSSGWFCREQMVRSRPAAFSHWVTKMNTNPAALFLFFKNTRQQRESLFLHSSSKTKTNDSFTSSQQQQRIPSKQKPFKSSEWRSSGLQNLTWCLLWFMQHKHFKEVFYCEKKKQEKQNAKLFGSYKEDFNWTGPGPLPGSLQKSV